MSLGESLDQGDWVQGVSECIHEPLARAVQRFADQTAIDFLGRQTTWRQLDEQVGKIARGLAAIGVCKGSRVALMLPNSPYYVISYHAVARLGAIVVNLNPLYAPGEVRALIADSGATVAITMDLKLMLPKILECVGEGGLERVVVCSMTDALPRSTGLLFQLFRRSELASLPDGRVALSWDRVLDLGEDAALPAVTIDPMTDLAVLQYTGGTTGLPKGAMLTHANVVTNAAQVAYWYTGHEPGMDRMLGVLPLFHVFAMTVVMNMAVQLGATMILLPRFKLSQVLDVIERKKPTIFPVVPSLLNTINNEPGIGSRNLSSLRFCISGGAPLPVEVKESFERRTGSVVVEGYGLSEVSPVVTCNPTTGPNKPGSIGLPMPGTTVSLRDPDNPAVEVGRGEPGEICVRGPAVMRGYWRNGEATRATFVDGWLRTGDIGRMDEDGYLFLIDRIKDLILVNGYNVYPRVVEDALYTHEAVEEAIVIGVPDDEHGELPKAFVKLREGAQLDPGELRVFLAARLSPMERPCEIEIRNELPKTMIGKLSKKELVAEERAKRETAGA
ncbi:MAG: long-chain fatty acid--CoA ligase [Geminicoccaceae bacterium]|nr:long-chain fatty acid--CoA ligase [Geminicoccaceae bacterium]